MSLAHCDTDPGFMERAIALAMRGRGAVEPNPMVGCVIVKDGRVIGEGFHERFGGPHAEPNALAACTESPAGATAYVTLEPCCHVDKKTPPCVPRLIEARLARVVIGAVDPNPKVAGRGITQIRAAGIAADLLDVPAARQLIAPFVAQMVYRRPYVTLKWAESADGKIAGPAGRRTQITGAPSTRVIHELRARSDAILVGIDTVINDDPMLTVRLAQTWRPLTRIILDSRLRLSPESKLARSAGQGDVIVYTLAQAASDARRRQRLESAGVEVRTAPADATGRLSLQSVIGDLGARQWTHLLVEPGPTLARSFLSGGGPWDRLWIFRSPTRIDDESAPAAAEPVGTAVGQAAIGADILTEYLNPRSDVMFEKTPSADFRLASQSRYNHQQ